MSERLERGAEIVKLARLLGVEPKELGYLDQIPAAALRTFRAQATDRLFAGDAGRLDRVAAASKLVPVPLTVKIAQIAFGPLLCSATAGRLDPRHAVRVASKCPTSFLADIAINLDPRRAAGVIAAVPTPLVVAVARELIARDEHVTMGRFVSFLRPDTLRAAVPEIPDDADLLKVAFVMEGKERLDDLLDIARDRFPGLVRTAYEQDLWAEALDLIGHLSLANRAELADIAAAQDDDLLDGLVRAAQRLPAWDAVLPITAAMSPASLRRFADLPAVQEPEVLAAIVDAALANDLWLDLLPLTTHLSDVARARLARLPLLQRADVLGAVIEAAARHDLWAAVLPLADALPEAAKPRIAEYIGELSRDQLLAALDAASRSSNLPTLVEIALRQQPPGRQRVLDVIAGLDRLDEFAALLTAATPELVWAALLEVRDEMPDAVRQVVRARADQLDRADLVARLTAAADPPPPRRRPRPGRRAEA